MSWFLLYAVAVSGIAISVGMLALFYLYRTTNYIREIRESINLLGRVLEVMADEQRRSHWQMLHPPARREGAGATALHVSEAERSLPAA